MVLCACQLAKSNKRVKELRVKELRVVEECESGMISGCMVVVGKPNWNPSGGAGVFLPLAFMSSLNCRVALEFVTCLVSASPPIPMPHGGKRQNSVGLVEPKLKFGWKSLLPLLLLLLVVVVVVVRH